MSCNHFDVYVESTAIPDEDLTLLQKDLKWWRIIALVPYMYNYVPSILSNVAKIHIIFAFDV